MMGTGQMMITIGAMMLLTLVILRVNNSLLSTNSVMLDSKFGVMAVSLATSVIEEASGKAYDELADTNSAASTADFTVTGNFGPDGGEVWPQYDDFDDYHNYHRNTATDSTIKSAYYDINCKVTYINPGTPDGSTSTRTYHKKITVQITSPSMSDTIRMSSIYSYWYFR